MLRFHSRECQRRKISRCCVDDFSRHTHHPHQVQLQVYFSGDSRFQPVLVDQPTVEDTISILRGLKERFEAHHGVTIADNALVSASVLSNRYITERFLSDKAIDLVDEACAKLRNSSVCACLRRGYWR